MPPRRWLLVAAGVVGALLVGAAVSAVVPRTLDEGTTRTAASWQVTVTPGVVAPRFTAVHDGAEAVAEGTRWPGSLQAEVLAFEDPVTGASAFTAVVGSAPLGADSVRITTTERGVRESTVRLLGWHRVHAEAFDGDVDIIEVAAIGSGGEVIAVLDGDDPA